MNSNLNKKFKLRILTLIFLITVALSAVFIILNNNSYYAEAANYESKQFVINSFFTSSSSDIIDNIEADEKYKFIPNGVNGSFKTNLEDLNSSDDAVKTAAKKELIDFFGIKYRNVELFDENGLPKSDTNFDVQISIKNGELREEKTVSLADWLNHESDNFAYKLLKNVFFLGENKFYFIVTPKNGATIDGLNKPVRIEAKYNFKLAFEKAFNIYYQSKQIWFNEDLNKWEYKILLSDVKPNKLNVISTYYTGDDIKIGLLYSKDYLIKKQLLKPEATDEEYYAAIGYNKDVKAFTGEIKHIFNPNYVTYYNKPIHFGKEVGELGYKPVAIKDGKVKDWANGIKIIIEKQPILYTFSSFEKQKEFIKVIEDISEGKTMAEIDSILSSKITANLRISGYAAKSDEALLNEYTDLETDKYNYYKFMLKLQKNSNGKFSSSIAKLDTYFLMLLEDNKPGKVYTSFENEELSVFGLNSKKYVVNIRAENKKTYEEIDNANAMKHLIEYKKVILADKYIFDIAIENKNIVLVNDKLEYITGNFTDGSSDYSGSSSVPSYAQNVDGKWRANVALRDKTEGQRFKFIYTIMKAEIPQIDFPQLNESAPYTYTGQPIEFKPFIHGDNKNIAYKLTFKKVGGVESELFPQNAGEYEINLEVTDPNYNLEDKTKSILNTGGKKIKILPIDFIATIDVSLSTIVINGKPTPTTVVNITLPNDLTIADSETKFSIDNGEFTSDTSKLVNLPTGRHTIKVYSSSSNFKKIDSNQTPIIEKTINVPDKREIPMLGQIIGGIIPTVAPFDVMIAFLLAVVLAIVSIIMIAVAVPKFLRSKKVVNKPLKDKKIKRYDNYYYELMNERTKKKKAKLDEKNSKKLQKMEANKSKKADKVKK